MGGRKSDNRIREDIFRETNVAFHSMCLRTTPGAARNQVHDLCLPAPRPRAYSTA